jgi:hypothetical protein
VADPAGPPGGEPARWLTGRVDPRPSGSLLSRRGGSVGRSLDSFRGGFAGSFSSFGGGFASGSSGIASSFSGFGRCGSGFLSGFHRSLILLGAGGQRQGQRQRGENHFRVHVIDHPN